MFEKKGCEKMNEIILQNINGEILANSREIAERFGKEHKTVIRNIENLVAQNCATKNLYTLSSYINRGKSYKEYLMNRDGFSLLVMGFTGKEALEWKLKYIEAFNKMEDVIKQQTVKALPTTYKEALQQLLEQVEQNELLLTENERLEPLAKFAEHVTESSNAIDIGDFSKIVKNEVIDIGRNRLFEWLRNKEILMKDNVPYQRYVDNNWFKVIETTKETSYGTKCFSKTLITGRGQVRILEKLRKEFIDKDIKLQ